MEQKNNLLIPASILLAGFAIAGGIYFSNKGNGPVNPTPNNASSDIVIKAVSADDHIRGNPDAPVKLVEFSDMECPFCKSFHTTMQTIIDTYGKDGKVAWVYRHFPLDSIHPKARKEAEAVECANELGGSAAFWKMLDTVYKNTPANNGLDLAKLPEYALSAGVNTEAFNACLSSGKYASKVQAQFEDGIKAGAQGTPYNVLILKDALSSSAEEEIKTYITTNGLAQYVRISKSKKEISMSGALPLDILKTILDAVLQK